MVPRRLSISFLSLGVPRELTHDPSWTVAPIRHQAWSVPVTIGSTFLASTIEQVFLGYRLYTMYVNWPCFLAAYIDPSSSSKNILYPLALSLMLMVDVSYYCLTALCSVLINHTIGSLSLVRGCKHRHKSPHWGFKRGNVNPASKLHSCLRML